MKNLFKPFGNEMGGIEIPTQLNNPFDSVVPTICVFAAQLLQDYILENESNWKHDFGFESGLNAIDSNAQAVKGKMFGVLVVRSANGELGYLSAYSGNLSMNNEAHPFVPSVFDAVMDNSFIHTGMRELTVLSDEIKQVQMADGSDSQQKIDSLKKSRKLKSHQLQQELFAHYYFSNKSGRRENLNTIFSELPDQRPAAGTGECAAPKLLQYAFQNQLEPIAISEFWWGRSPKTIRREHKMFYPACQNKCRFLLEFMLQDSTLFDAADL